MAHSILTIFAASSMIIIDIGAQSTETILFNDKGKATRTIEQIVQPALASATSSHNGSAKSHLSYHVLTQTNTSRTSALSKPTTREIPASLSEAISSQITLPSSKIFSATTSSTILTSVTSFPRAPMTSPLSAPSSQLSSTSATATFNLTRVDPTGHLTQIFSSLSTTSDLKATTLPMPVPPTALVSIPSQATASKHSTSLRNALIGVFSALVILILFSAGLYLYRRKRRPARTSSQEALARCTDTVPSSIVPKFGIFRSRVRNKSIRIPSQAYLPKLDSPTSSTATTGTCERAFPPLHDQSQSPQYRPLTHLHSRLFYLSEEDLHAMQLHPRIISQSLPAPPSLDSTPVQTLVYQLQHHGHSATILHSLSPSQHSIASHSPVSQYHPSVPLLDSHTTTSIHAPIYSTTDVHLSTNSSLLPFQYQNIPRPPRRNRNNRQSIFPAGIRRLLPLRLLQKFNNPPAPNGTDTDPNTNRTVSFASAAEFPTFPPPSIVSTRTFAAKRTKASNSAQRSVRFAPAPQVSIFEPDLLSSSESSISSSSRGHEMYRDGDISCYSHNTDPNFTRGSCDYHLNTSNTDQGLDYNHSHNDTYAHNRKHDTNHNDHSHTHNHDRKKDTDSDTASIDIILDA